MEDIIVLKRHHVTIHNLDSGLGHVVAFAMPADSAKQLAQTLLAYVEQSIDPSESDNFTVELEVDLGGGTFGITGWDFAAPEKSLNQIYRQQNCCWQHRQKELVSHDGEG
jgi:hypothetical protein